MNLKQSKGIGLSDAIIAIAIFMIFTGIIVSISYNIYIQSNFIKRNDHATNYIVEAFEYAQGLVYDNINNDELINYINNKYEKVKAISGKYVDGAERQEAYTIFVDVTDVNVGYVKQIEITVMYELGGKVRTVNMKTLVNK